MSETTNDTRTDTRTEPSTDTGNDRRGSDHAQAVDRRASAANWLEQEFPGWSVQVDETAGWEGELRPLWIARRDGHHPQAELTAAKLHSRLSDYLSREQRRNAFAN